MYKRQVQGCQDGFLARRLGDDQVAVSELLPDSHGLDVVGQDFELRALGGEARAEEGEDARVGHRQAVAGRADEVVSCDQDQMLARMQEGGQVSRPCVAELVLDLGSEHRFHLVHPPAACPGDCRRAVVSIANARRALARAGGWLLVRRLRRWVITNSTAPAVSAADRRSGVVRSCAVWVEMGRTPSR